MSLQMSSDSGRPKMPPLALTCFTAASAPADSGVSSSSPAVFQVISATSIGAPVAADVVVAAELLVVEAAPVVAGALLLVVVLGELLPHAAAAMQSPVTSATPKSRFNFSSRTASEFVSLPSFSCNAPPHCDPRKWTPAFLYQAILRLPQICYCLIRHLSPVPSARCACPATLMKAAPRDTTLNKPGRRIHTAGRIIASVDGDSRPLRRRSRRVA